MEAQRRLLLTPGDGPDARLPPPFCPSDRITILPVGNPPALLEVGQELARLTGRGESL